MDIAGTAHGRSIAQLGEFAQHPQKGVIRSGDAAIGPGTHLHLRSGSYVRVVRLVAEGTRALCVYVTPSGLDLRGGEHPALDLPVYVLRCGAVVGVAA